MGAEVVHPGLFRADEPFECNAAPGKASGLVVLALGMAGACYFCAMLNISFRATLVAWFGLVFFLLWALMYARDVCRRGVVMRLDADGFEDKRLGIEKISWAEVAAIAVVTEKSRRFICLKLRNEAAWLPRLALTHRLMAYLNKALGYPPLWINFHSTDREMIDGLLYLRTIQPGLVIER